MEYPTVREHAAHRTESRDNPPSSRPDGLPNSSSLLVMGELLQDHIKN
jgi:hypothetical protein